VLTARISCPDYAAANDAFFRALELLAEEGPFAARGEPLLIKPNLLAARSPETAVTTHPALLEAALRAAADLGAKAVVADSPGIGSAEKVARACGVLDVCRRYNVPVIDLGQTERIVVSGDTYKEMEVARPALEAGWLWNLPKWKTHTMMGMTLGVKNLYGCVPGKQKIAMHFRAGRNPESFAAFLLDLEKLISPTLTVLDGAVAMEGAGPGKGTPINRGLILASRDAHALDHEAARLSGFSVEAVPTLRLAVETGRLDLNGLKTVGDAAEPMQFDPAPGSPCDYQLPAAVKFLARGATSPTPRFDKKKCTGCNICVEHCPANALKSATPPELVDDACIRCYCCQELCPTGAAFLRRFTRRSK